MPEPLNHIMSRAWMIASISGIRSCRFNRNSIVAVVIGVMMVGVLARGVDAESQTNTHICTYSSDQVSRALSILFAFQGEVQSVRRNSSGTALHVVGRKLDGEVIGMTITPQDRRMIKVLGQTAYFDDQGKVVVWSADLRNGVYFANGYLLHLPLYSLFDVAPGGRYFLIGEKPCSTWIGNVNKPDIRILLSTNLLGVRLFERAGQLLVCGKENGGTKAVNTMCFIVSEDQYKIIKQINLTQFGGVIDVDFKSERFLVENDWDMFCQWFVYDPKTKGKSRVGRAANAGFFLFEDILKVAVSQRK